MESQLEVWLILALVAASWGQESCDCATNRWTQCEEDESGSCTCTLVGSDRRVDCSTLTSKCFLMKAEMTPSKSKRFHSPSTPLVGNEGLYNPDCEDSGGFKARQCDPSGTCWCVDSAGVRRTEKGDRSLSCGELTRTSCIYVELKHRIARAFEDGEVANALERLLQNRYKLRPEYIAGVKYDAPFIQIRLDQDDSEKSDSDVDIADVAYYFEKDIKNDSVFHANNKLNVSVNGKALDIENIQIYYIDKTPPQFSARRMISGITVVVTVVTLIIIFGVTVLVILKWRRVRNYKRFQIRNGSSQKSNLTL
ncbi:TACD2 protein, partial [Crypturellus undulatus]|nr:TACD2 protein [Crypturellus undulatus]